MNNETLAQNQEHLPLPVEATMFAGFTAVQEPKVGLRTEVVDGFAVATDLPEGVLPFEPTPVDKAPIHPFYRSLLPSALDGLPAGEFSVGSPDPASYFDRKITITEDEDGKRVDFIKPMLGTHNAGRTIELMHALGYGFGNEIPTPLTLQRKAAEVGVDIQLIADQSLIDNQTYLGAFRDGKYPISTASAEYYVHDAQDAHLTAVVLGAEPLKAALQIAAKEALEDDTIADAYVEGIDNFTDYLRGAISPTHNNMPMAYGVESLQVVGKSLGMSAETVIEILETGKANAQRFGMIINQ